MENSGLSPRQNKFASLIQKEIAILLQKQIREKGLLKLLISVTKVNITADLSIARIYLSIYPSSQAKKVLESIQKNSFKIKHNNVVISSLFSVIFCGKQCSKYFFLSTIYAR